MASNSFNKFALFENRGILGWSIMLIVDWLMWQLWLKENFWIPKKKTLRDKLTTPIVFSAIAILFF